MSDSHLQKLHDRATRGEPLSNEEQAALDAWYAQQDQSESEALSRTATAVTIPDLQAQLDASLRQLETVTQHIREAVMVNNDLRREIGQLQRLRAHPSPGHGARESP
jgi:transposase-like protein